MITRKARHHDYHLCCHSILKRLTSLTLFWFFAGNMADVFIIASRLAAPGIYNSLSHIDIDSTRHICQAVSLTQTLLAKAGLEPVVGVSRLQKHFYLASDEVVVAELSMRGIFLRAELVFSFLIIPHDTLSD
jgi:hypothetical protein